MEAFFKLNQISNENIAVKWALISMFKGVDWFNIMKSAVADLHVHSKILDASLLGLILFIFMQFSRYIIG